MFLIVFLFQYFQTKKELCATVYITKKNYRSRKNLASPTLYSQIWFLSSTASDLSLVTFWHFQHSPLIQIPEE